MPATHSSQGPAVDFGAIETLVKQGKTVVSAEDSAVIELVMKTIEEGKTATFYLKDVLFTEIIRKRYSTPERATAVNFQPLSSEEAARIKADFNIELDGYSSKETCPRCGSVYGTYEFIQQGIKEHGEEAVRAVFSLEGVSVLQVHPRQNIFCQKCGLDLGVALPAARLPVKIVVIGPHSYLYRSANHGYACCR
jgi:hypothetical protein